MDPHGSAWPFSRHPGIPRSLATLFRIRKRLGVHVVVEVVASQEDGLSLLVGGDAPRLSKGLEVALEVVQRALGAVP